MSVASDLPLLGGKGANLAHLASAGLPVPRFVVLTTDAYRTFVADAGLAPVITAALRQGPATASETIRAAFAAAAPSPEQRAAILADLEPLLTDGELTSPVAVRSSATAEDLPGLSFAGQQDTFLEVATLDAVLASVVACWSSLWTERAITYRDRHRIGHDVALAVVVQQMVDADASGVLFTANPATGLRDETVVEAVPGLGEALVSGQATPDVFTLETATGAVRSRSLAAGSPCVASTHLAQLVSLARRVVELYGEPMDIEWARTGDEVFVLQARPITSLYPLPGAADHPSSETRVWFSIGAFQGVLEPLTPLGQDALRMLGSAVPRLLGRQVDWRTNGWIQPAGERLWIRLDGVLRTRATRTPLVEFLPLFEPASAEVIQQLAGEPGLQPTRIAPPPRIAAALAVLAPRATSRILSARRHAEAVRGHLDRTAEGLVDAVAADLVRAGGHPTPQARLTARVDALDRFTRSALPMLLPAAAPVLGPTVLGIRQLRELAAHTPLPDADALALTVTRALPGNVTTEMDLALSDVAATIQADATAWGWVQGTAAPALARQYLAGNLPTTAQRAIGAFLDRYGMRGVAEIDLGRRRWQEDPTPVLHTVKSYLALPRDAAPRAVHAAGQREAGRAINTLAAASTRRRARRVRDVARSVRGLAGGRETPKFTLIRSFGLLRDGLLASGRELVEQGRLGAADDIAFLRVEELTRAFSADWHDVVGARRQTWETEARRARVPRVLVSDGRTFFDGVASGEGDLTGQGVSPGVVEGVVRVVDDPRTGSLRPGEILVCRGTDPAWTPLFLVAGGLVTEVGGLMTHGSVVAREYGLPAVVGVHDATRRLVDGERVRLDGASGTLVRLTPAS